MYIFNAKYKFLTMKRFALSCFCLIYIILGFYEKLYAQNSETEILRNTDSVFSQYSAKYGMQKAFVKFSADKGVLLRPNHLPILGRKAIEQYLDNVDDSTTKLTWKPQFADVAKSGDLGYTYGTYCLQVKDENQKWKAYYGTYVSVWRKNDNGQWRFVLDTGNQGLKNEK